MIIKNSLIYLSYCLCQKKTNQSLMIFHYGLNYEVYRRGINLFKKILIYNILQAKIKKENIQKSRKVLRHIASFMAQFDLMQTTAEYWKMLGNGERHNFLTYPFNNKTDQLLQVWLMHCSYILTGLNHTEYMTSYIALFDLPKAQECNRLLQSLLLKAVLDLKKKNQLILN